MRHGGASVTSRPCAEPARRARPGRGRPSELRDDGAEERLGPRGGSRQACDVRSAEVLGVEIEAGERGAGADAELPEDVAEVEVDRARAEEQLGGHVPVRQALRHETGDLELLCGQLGSRARVALARRLAAGAQLDPSPLRPERRSEALEGVESRSEVLARLDSAPGAAEELAVGELGARALEGTGSLGVGAERRRVETFGLAPLLP